MTKQVRRPYMKWAGSKTKLVGMIQGLIPADFIPTRLVEPFLGSGSVALNFGLKRAVLADINPDLIMAHQQVAADPDGFLEKLLPLFEQSVNTPESYSRLRDEYNGCQDPTRRATLLVYLNRHGFNGLVRYSKAGRFNTPFGYLERPYLPKAEIREFARVLNTAEFRTADFQEIMALAGPGDLVYCDPPYVSLSKTANFTAYASGGFSLAQHHELITAAKTAAGCGALVILSNHDTPISRELCQNADQIREVAVTRTISCNGAGRGKVKELMAVYLPGR